MISIDRATYAQTLTFAVRRLRKAARYFVRCVGRAFLAGARS